MMLVEDLKAEIEALPISDFQRLRRWIEEKDWESWDDQIAEDSESGHLDFLLEEAFSAKTQGSLSEL